MAKKEQDHQALGGERSWAAVEETSAATPRPHLSVVAPVYNEEGNLHELYRRLREALDPIDERWELLLVDDGSRDRSYEIMRELHEEDPRVAAIKFSRNFGHHIAMTAGLDKADGEYVIMMDSDLQDRPEEIPRLYEALHAEDVDIVIADRRNKKFGPLKRLNSWLFHAIMRRLFQGEFVGGVFRIMRRRVVLEVRRCREHDRLLVGLIDWTGFTQYAIPVEHAERRAGETSYSLRKQLQLAANSFTAFTTTPLRFASWLGLIVFFSSFVFAMWLVFRRLVWGYGVEGWTSLIVVINLLGGMQMLALGIIGEYIGRIFNATRQRPLYVIDTQLRGHHAPPASEVTP